MNSQIYPNDFREYFARKYGMQIFFFLGFSFMVSVFFIIPGSSASSLSQRFLMQLSGLVVGLSWLVTFLWFFLPVLSINNKRLIFSRTPIRKPLIIPLSHLISAVMDEKKMTMTYKEESQNEVKIIFIQLGCFLQEDKIRLINDINTILPV